MLPKPSSTIAFRIGQSYYYIEKFLAKLTNNKKGKVNNDLAFLLFQNLHYAFSSAVVVGSASSVGASATAGAVASASATGEGVPSPAGVVAGAAAFLRPPPPRRLLLAVVSFSSPLPLP
jgi:hypothetical protein